MRTRANSGILIHDEYFDPSNSLDKIRGQCDELCELFYSFLFIKKNCARNMDKLLLIKLEAVWGKMRCLVSELGLCKSLPLVDWLPAIWLHVIGCPPTVRCVDDLIFLVCEVWLKESNHNGFQDEASLKRSLMENGFRGFLAGAIVSRVIDIDFFECMLVDIAEPISWNSFLISDNGTCCSVYAVGSDSPTPEIAGRSELKLHVVDDTDKQEVPVSPLPFIITDMNWLPGTFAEHVYGKIQEILSAKGPNEYCVYGHCTSEQYVIDMSKTGMSPFASMTNRMSCGHAMYFFRMEKSNHSFQNLCNGAGEDERDGEQFRSFVYAFSIPFSQRECHPLSPAVLLFLIKKDTVSVFDAVEEKLPIVGFGEEASAQAGTKTDNSTNWESDLKLEASTPAKPIIPVGGVGGSWICKCKRKIDGKINLNMDHLTFTDDFFPAADIANAVASVDLPEKFNCMALLSGIVAFDDIGTDVIRANICDNGIKPLPVNCMKCWNQRTEFDKWKVLVRGSIDDFRRPYVLFDFNGRFVTRKPYFTKKGESTCFDNFKASSEKIIDMPEYLFFSVDALKKLLSESESVSVAFINNRWMKTYLRSDCFHEAYNSNPKKYSSENSKKRLFQVNLQRKLHPFWMLKADCKENKCVKDI